VALYGGSSFSRHGARGRFAPIFAGKAFIRRDRRDIGTAQPDDAAAPPPKSETP
jgi:hypothetical protein